VTTAPKTIEELAGDDPSETVALTCIDIPEALVIVDCGAKTEKTREFRQSMEEQFKRKTTHLFLTHSHWDHVDALNVFQDVAVVISKKGAANLKADIKVVKEFVLGSEENEVQFHVSGGHSPDSAYVYYPKEQVLITGDNLLSCYAQVFSNGKLVLDLYRSWESLDVIHLIPGHGFVVDKDYLKNVRAYFEDLIQVLKELKAQGLTINQVLKHADVPEYCYKDHPLWKEGGRRYTGWLNSGIKYWYRHV
jgi:glyoxylase-like metal-dependent hydrolase (beta-lactamase superfamily II)